ncbi:hypothetical protein K0M31_009543, partial [Melipona bicolor]
DASFVRFVYFHFTAELLNDMKFNVLDLTCSGVGFLNYEFRTLTSTSRKRRGPADLRRLQRSKRRPSSLEISCNNKRLGSLPSAPLMMSLGSDSEKKRINHFLLPTTSNPFHSFFHHASFTTYVPTNALDDT